VLVAGQIKIVIRPDRLSCPMSWKKAEIAVYADWPAARP
jgi:hypothetical protein